MLFGERRKYELRASIIIPKARNRTPAEILLNPDAKIPLPNFLVTSYMISAAATAANAATNEVPLTIIVKKRVMSIILGSYYFAKNLATVNIIQHFV